jgi:predicted RNA binding protein YcfA (HicA-like mRNA interferase family)
VPRKVRELIADLEAAGFTQRGGKGSHRNFTHPRVKKPVTISGKTGSDAKQYQERIVRLAIEESKDESK